MLPNGNCTPRDRKKQSSKDGSAREGDVLGSKEIRHGFSVVVFVQSAYRDRWGKYGNHKLSGHKEAICKALGSIFSIEKKKINCTLQTEGVYLKKANFKRQRT